MAKVILTGLEALADGQICRVLAIDSHQVEHHPQSAVARDLLHADIVFAGGEPARYMSLLKRVRQARPTLPFVVVTRMPEPWAWLDALEAGATDCCAAPIETRYLRWLMESALLRPAELHMSRAAMQGPAVATGGSPDQDTRARGR